MTDDDKALVERLRDDWPEILVEKHWMMDSDAIDKQREEAADRIEALSAENERLTQRYNELGNLSLEKIGRGAREIVRLEIENEWLRVEAQAQYHRGYYDGRAALGETK